MLYHGTTKPVSVLNAGSWLTQIPTHAIEQAKKRAAERKETGYVLSVQTGNQNVRTPTVKDRNDENQGNNFEEENWVWVNTVDLKVEECLTISEAEQRFLGATNLFSK
ncbi:MAG: hypothetical protein ACREFE_11530 [Limisphaerales bacterium]